MKQLLFSLSLALLAASCSSAPRLDLAAAEPGALAVALEQSILLPGGEPAAGATLRLSRGGEELVVQAGDDGVARIPRWNREVDAFERSARLVDSEGHSYGTRGDVRGLAADADGLVRLDPLELAHTTRLVGRFVRPEFEIYPPWVALRGGEEARRFPCAWDGSFEVADWPTSASPITVEAYCGPATAETSVARPRTFELGPRQLELDLGEEPMREVAPTSELPGAR